MSNLPADQKKGPPFTVDRYGSFGECLIAERDWLRAENERLRSALTTIKHRVRDLADNSRFVTGSERWQTGQDMKVTLRVIDDALGSSDTRGENYK